MRYAIACEAEQVSAHFGRCEYYELVDIENEEAVERECLLSPGHGEPGELPRLMQQHGVDCVICGGAGPRAQNLFNEIGIDFVLGVAQAAPCHCSGGQTRQLFAQELGEDFVEVGAGSRLKCSHSQ